MSIWPGTPDEIGAVTASDGVGIAIETFEPAAPAGAVVVFLHGIGAYAGPYRRFARRLADTGTHVILPDLRGHGRSGTRGRMGSPDMVMADIGALIEHARAVHPDSEIVLAGESMGGLFALSYAASARPQPDRLLLLAPAMRPHWGRWLQSGVGHLAALPRAVQAGEGISMHAPIPGEPMRDPDFRRRVRGDPMMLQRVSVAYLATIARLMVGSSARYPSRVEMPCLVVQGDADFVLDQNAAFALVSRIDGAELKVVEGGWHNLLWDPTWEDTAAFVARWLSGDRDARD